MDSEVFSGLSYDTPALQGALARSWKTLAGFNPGASSQGDLFAYFKALDGVLAGLGSAGNHEAVDAVTFHVDYLADAAGCHSCVLFAGEHFVAADQVVLDALANIGDVLRRAPRQTPQDGPMDIPAPVFAAIVDAEARLEGWCSREKALVIAATVLREQPETCVEIGVYGGRSLIPCAAALRHIGSGLIYGIEAWRPSVAIENPTDAVNDAWWSHVDFPAIKQAFYSFVADRGLTRQVCLIEAASGRVASVFDRIDYLHIDGSHSAINAAEDVILYARKVRPGGIVIFDDVDWDTTAPARAILNTLCDVETVLKDKSSGKDICLVLRRR